MQLAAHYDVLSSSPFFNLDLRDGIKILGALPTTVSSCVVFTIGANGDGALAIFNATLSNLFGIFLTPALLIFFLDSSHHAAPYKEIVQTIALVILLPLIVGFATRRCVNYVLDHSKDVRYKRFNDWLLRFQWSTIPLAIIIVITYTAFCSTFSTTHTADTSHELKPLALFVLAAFLVVSHLLFLVLAFGLMNLPFLGFRSRKKKVAMLFSSAEKTVAMGIPLIAVIFSGGSLGILSLPILFYHSVQTLIDATLMIPMKKWVGKDPQLVSKFIYEEEHETTESASLHYGQINY
eukprot:TRINITY_DN7514_c0_g2_i1.p1 TRINITY_DN7514_c0_g2~~TRINITY_DN7514_c0_g2_i1.p1  ORF type:complete len:293 (-),score=22.57 TRINITY_DN7514_c0_g2_i1:32-910(-)